MRQHWSREARETAVDLWASLILRPAKARAPVCRIAGRATWSLTRPGECDGLQLYPVIKAQRKHQSEPRSALRARSQSAKEPIGPPLSMDLLQDVNVKARRKLALLK